jgi:hypothetical protein
MPGVPKELIEHSLNVYPQAVPKKDNEPGSPVSRDLVESIRRQKHIAQGDEADRKDEDETYLEYHSPEEGNTSGEDSDID